MWKGLNKLVPSLILKFSWLSNLFILFMPSYPWSYHTGSIWLIFLFGGRLQRQVWKIFWVSCLWINFLGVHISVSSDNIYVPNHCLYSTFFWYSSRWPIHVCIYFCWATLMQFSSGYFSESQFLFLEVSILHKVILGEIIAD